MKPKRIPVKSSAGRYEVLCGTGALRRLRTEIGSLGKFSSVQVVSSAKVWRAVGKIDPRLRRPKRHHSSDG